MIEVWHAINPNFGFGEGNVHFPNDFELVAVVNTSELGQAFALSNTIDKPWWENDGVSVMIPDREGFRSTSVGDVLVTRDYKIHIVMPSGFQKRDTVGPQFWEKNLYKGKS